MRKFTIFTIILFILILAMVAEVFTNDYLPNLKKSDIVSESASTLPDGMDLSKTIQTNILGYDGSTNKPTTLDIVTAPVKDPELNTTSGVVRTNPSKPVNFEDQLNNTVNDFGSNQTLPTSSVSDFEDLNFNLKQNSVWLRDEMVKSAGFSSANVDKEEPNGFMFKTIYIDDLYDVSSVKYQIVSDLQLLAKVQVLNVGPLSSLTDVYEVLKARVVDSANVSINESNTYGLSSFYMNDTTRLNVAFVVVKFDSAIYSFSYPKEYHSQIVNLIKLIDMEF